MECPAFLICPQLGRGRCKKAFFLLVMHKAEAREVGGTLAIDLRRDGHIVAVRE